MKATKIIKNVQNNDPNQSRNNLFTPCRGSVRQAQLPPLVETA